MTTDRSEYIAGLRELADLLEAHPSIPLPYAAGTSGEYPSDKLTFFCESKDQLLAVSRAVRGKLEKKIDDAAPYYGFELHGQIRGLYFYAAIHREQVCRRVVTGTREVVKTVPAPDAPMVEVTETVEDVEWICEPLLAEVSA